MTSTQAVAAVRRIFDAQKAAMPARSIHGHRHPCHRLGEATKTVPYAMDAEKTYRFTAAGAKAGDSGRCRKAR